MTQVCCPSCRLRFTPATAAYLTACPECGERLQPIAGLEQVLGFRLFDPEESPVARPEALAASLPIPEPPVAR